METKRQLESKVIRTSGGYYLEIPQNNNAPRLLIEWLCTFRSGKFPVQAMDMSAVADTFLVKLNLPGKMYEDACNYINQNL